MPTNVNDFGLTVAMRALDRTLREIKSADGYNTTPHITFGAKLPEKIPDSDFPGVSIEMADMNIDEEKFGGASQGVMRFGWVVQLWGFVKVTSGDRRKLVEAGLALLSDVFAVIYAEETLPDGDGQGTVLAVPPDGVIFDMESFSQDGRGYFVARFDLVVDILRGSEP